MQIGDQTKSMKGVIFMMIMIASIPAWEKTLCVLIGLTLYGTMKVMDYYTEKDRKEAEAR